jgi:hypothetical protein
MVEKILTASTSAFKLSGIAPEKQIAQSIPLSKSDPSPAAMLFAVMQHVAALTVGFEIARLVVARIMIEVGGR